MRLVYDVLDAATSRLVDPTDALTHIDLSTLTDGSGGLDSAKVTEALDNLVQRKPHLAKVVDGRREARRQSPTINRRRGP